MAMDMDIITLQMKPPGYILIYIGRNIVICMVLMGIYYVYHNVVRSPNSSGLLAKMNDWDQGTKRRVLDTYVYLLFMLLLTVFSVVCSFQSAVLMKYLMAYPNTAVLLTIIVMAIINGFIEVLPFTTQSPMEAAVTMLSSIILGPAISLFGPYVILFAATYTVMLLLLLTAIVLVSPKDHFSHFLPSVLSCVYIAVSIASLITLMVGLPLSWAGISVLCMTLYGGLILYAGVFLVNTQLFFKEAQMGGQQFDPLYITIILYLSTLNLFLRVAMYMIVIQMVSYELPEK